MNQEKETVKNVAKQAATTAIVTTNLKTAEPNRRMQSFTAKFDHFVLAIEGGNP
jgi:hypothetical protein